MLALVLRTILHYYRLLLPVALGVAVSSAVIVGALLVGDSMRGSLKDIAMDRIGSIDSVVLAPRWFDAKRLEQAATALSSNDGQPTEIHGLLLLPSVVAEIQDRSGESEGKITTRRSTELTLLGTDEAFWNLGSIRPARLPKGNELVLNASLAEKLDAHVGDRVTLKVSRDAVVPADSALGKRENEVIALSRWEVVDILPDKSLARFSLKSDQRPVQNVFADKAALQSALDIENQINTVMTRHREASEAVPSRTTDKSHAANANAKSLLSALQLELDDLGLRWERIDRVFPDANRNEQTDGDSATQSPAKLYSYDQLTSEQMMIQDTIADAIQAAMKDAVKYVVNNPAGNPTQIASGEKTDGGNIQAHSVLSYLANNTEVIAREGNNRESTGRSVPYSTISGVSWDVLSRMLVDAGVASEPPTGEDWVVINSWMARELQAQVGDRLRFD